MAAPDAEDIGAIDALEDFMRRCREGQEVDFAVLSRAQQAAVRLAARHGSNAPLLGDPSMTPASLLAYTQWVAQTIKQYPQPIQRRAGFV